MSTAKPLPWYDDWWTVKCNEFERGVLTGMLLKCGKSDSGGSGTWEKVDLIGNIAKIETWVSMDKAWHWSYYNIDCEDWYLHQKKTYADGTVEEWKVQLGMLIDGVYTLKKGDFTSWDFNSPDENGLINDITWTYTTDRAYTQTQFLKWYIPTTTAEVISV